MVREKYKYVEPSVYLFCLMLLAGKKNERTTKNTTACQACNQRLERERDPWVPNHNNKPGFKTGGRSSKLSILIILGFICIPLLPTLCPVLICNLIKTTFVFLYSWITSLGFVPVYQFIRLY